MINFDDFNEGFQLFSCFNFYFENKISSIDKPEQVHFYLVCWSEPNRTARSNAESVKVEEKSGR